MDIAHTLAVDNITEGTVVHILVVGSTLGDIHNLEAVIALIDNSLLGSIADNLAVLADILMPAVADIASIIFDVAMVRLLFEVLDSLDNNYALVELFVVDLDELEFAVDVAVGEVGEDDNFECKLVQLGDCVLEEPLHNKD